ncbi:hypothetical protein [Tenacibaculum amylolyticum]|uniref:hypothetical protein n=1 Tax=Tenacibaculum amylolyticum TaxID=104269 RepID=UPI00389503C6
MLKQMNIEGIKTLKKEELINIHGGSNMRTVNCRFPDNTSWEGNTTDENVLDDMINHCFASGGDVDIATSVLNASQSACGR